MADPSSGWGWPLNSRKAHYFKAGGTISLCSKWMFGGERRDDLHDSPDNCAACMRKREALESATCADSQTDRNA